jgi:tetratricopeptide (TPR) repeat protein
MSSRFESSQASLAAAVEAYREIDDEVGLIRATARRALGYLSATQITSAFEVIEPVREAVEALIERTDLAGKTGDAEAGEAAAIAAETIGRAHFRQNDMAEAIAWSDRALALADPLGLDEIVAMALITKGTSLTFTRTREGLALLEGAVIDARAHRQSIPALRGSNNLASSTLEFDPRASLERTREGMALARRLGILSFDGYHAGNAISAAERLGEWAWAREAIGALVDPHPEGGEKEWLAACAEWLDVWSGHPDTARVERIRAEAKVQADVQFDLNTSSWLARHAFVAGRPGDAVQAAEVHYLLIGNDPSEFAMMGRFALHAGRLDLARMTLAAGEGRSGGLVDHDIASMRAGIAALEGRTADALGLYRAALAGYRDMGCRFDVALTIFDMAALIGPHEPAVRAAIPEGREILEALGAQTLLDRLDEVEAGARPTPVTATRVGIAAEAAPEGRPER